QEIDAFLRQTSALRPSDPIYALIAYIVPGKHQGSLPELIENGYKLQMGQTHLGAYLGNGRTSNAPEEYHGRRWGVGGYPANVHVVSLQGVSQAVLNRNAHLADACLNRGVQFETDYMRARYRPIDLNTVLMFYRDWIRREAYLRNPSDRTWRTYCSAHKLIVLNVMLNVPHHEKWFAEIFGSEGADLFARFKRIFHEIHGRNFTDADRTDFTPLWKLQGLTAGQIRPFTRPEYDAYDKARRAGELGRFTGRRPVDLHEGVGFAPESTSELVDTFMETYAVFPRGLGVFSCGALFGFMGEVTSRMGITPQHYLAVAMPVFQSLMVADAMVRAKQVPDYQTQARNALYVAFGGTFDTLPGSYGETPAALDGDRASLDPKQLADVALADVRGRWSQIIGSPPSTPEQAYAWFRPAVAEVLARAREERVFGDEKAVDYYTAPSIVHHVAVGLHKGNKFVTVRAVCTAMDESELYKPAARRADAALAVTEEEVMSDEESEIPAGAADAASAILHDLNGPGYYRDPQILEDFLHERFGEKVAADAPAIAAAILEDLDGDRALQSRSTLGRFLSTRGLA
ncbi:MAG TPA: hypothetical protein VGR07_13625, partial [Thermoanaerobaculia bacterium]|nr:hypothetical protein [Thermoanaerobaculia bacterium]